jgi:hypothetical protein
MTSRDRRRSQVVREVRRRARGEVTIGEHPRACGKLRYASKSEAKSAIRRAMGFGNLREKELMSCYWCDKCDAWHIGHDRRRPEVRP